MRYAGFLLFLIFIEAQPFLKNATATTPGPVCVPITLQMSVESSESALSCQMSRLSSTYFLRYESLSPLYPRMIGSSKSMPPLSWIFCTSRLLPCFDPLALPIT